MKKLLFGLIIGLLAGGAVVWIVTGRHEPAKEEEKVHSESHVVQEGSNTFLKLDPETQQRMGLKTAPLEAMQLKPEVKAFGRVLDPAPLATMMTDLASARAQLEASSKEAARLKLLHDQNQNASTRTLEAAEAVVQRDKIALHAAELRLLTSWGREVMQRPDLDVFIHSLAAQETALVRIDVPATEKLEANPTAARVSLLASPEASIEAEFVSATVAADPQLAGRGYLFLLKTNSITANSIVTAWLTVPGEPEQGVLVPRDAIVRHEGEAFVYVQGGADKFERKEIELEHPLAQGWFVENLKPGMKIVITGAQQLLSEELKGEGGGE